MALKESLPPESGLGRKIIKGLDVAVTYGGVAPFVKISERNIKHTGVTLSHLGSLATASVWSEKKIKFLDAALSRVESLLASA